MTLDGRLVLPTNWDPALIDRVSPLEPAYLYGSLATERTMRTVLDLPDVDEDRAAEHVREAADAGIKVLYVMNGTCSGNREMSEEGRWELLQRCQWLLDSGFAGVVVADPFVMEIVTASFPELELHVSVLTFVDEPRKAEFFADLGAAVITLDPIVARDFRRLRAIRRAVDCKLSLVVNEGCLLQCPIRVHHSNAVSHSLESIRSGCHVDYCYYKCTLRKFANPVEFVRMPWIRPQDTQVYLDEGIDLFKIAGREKMGTGPSSHTDRIAEAARAYHLGRCDDLADLMVGIEPVAPLQGGSTPGPVVRINSGRLDGFLKFFVDGGCDLNCTRCSYCDGWAERSVTVQGDVPSYLQRVTESIDAARVGSYFTGAPRP